MGFLHTTLRILLRRAAEHIPSKLSTNSAASTNLAPKKFNTCWWHLIAFVTRYENTSYLTPFLRQMELRRFCFVRFEVSYLISLSALRGGAEVSVLGLNGGTVGLPAVKPVHSASREVSLKPTSE